MGNSDHVFVSVSIDFPQNGIPFSTVQLMVVLLLIGTIFVIIWMMFHASILNFILSLSKSLILNIRWNKPHSSWWSLAAFTAAIAHRNHFFHLYQQIYFLHLKWDSDRLDVILAKGFITLQNKGVYRVLPSGRWDVKSWPWRGGYISTCFSKGILKRRPFSIWKSGGGGILWL